MAQTIQKRRGTSAAWTSANPILAEGEEGYETDSRRSKVGDGVTTWTSLPYATGGGSSTTVVDGGNASSTYGGTTPIDGGHA